MRAAAKTGFIGFQHSVESNLTYVTMPFEPGAAPPADSQPRIGGLVELTAAGRERLPYWVGFDLYVVGIECQRGKPGLNLCVTDRLRVTRESELTDGFYIGRPDQADDEVPRP